MKRAILVCAAGMALVARGYNPAEGTVTVTERPAHERADGSLWLVMEPNSFVFIEKGLIR